MSMWVRLVGGLGNGEVKKIDDDQGEVIWRTHVPAPGDRAFRATYSLAADTIEMKKTRYTRRVVETPGGKITYFAVEGVSDFDALHHVLGP